MAAADTVVIVVAVVVGSAVEEELHRVTLTTATATELGAVLIPALLPYDALPRPSGRARHDASRCLPTG